MIEVEDLCKRFGPVEVLRGVSLSVDRGEVAAIIGPSGGGKSTFLRCLNGLERFQSGRVRIDGLPLCVRRVGRRRGRTGPASTGRSAGGWGWSSRGSTCSRTGRRSRT